jgi:hypothetical protein
MTDESPLSPRFVVWRCDHCRNGIEFDAVQLGGREVCRIACPHCGQETSLREPPPPPPLVPDEGWTQPAPVELPVAVEPEKPSFTTTSPPIIPPAVSEPLMEIPVAPEPKKIFVEPPPVPPMVRESVKEIPIVAPTPPPLVPKPITVSLPPDPLPPTHTRAPADVRWLTDLGVVYFRQHQFGEAFLCFSRAAQQGFAAAQFCLAVCYFNGHGTARDEAAAIPWLRQAAAQGDTNAEFTLGLAYNLGRGVAPDAVLAAQWLQQAATHGHPEAIVRTRKPAEATTPPASVPGKIPSPPATSGEPVPPEKSIERRRHDMQRLVLGLFGKK